MENDERFMKVALDEARRAAEGHPVERDVASGRLGRQQQQPLDGVEHRVLLGEAPLAEEQELVDDLVVLELEAHVVLPGPEVVERDRGYAARHVVDYDVRAVWLARELAAYRLGLLRLRG